MKYLKYISILVAFIFLVQACTKDRVNRTPEPGEQNEPYNLKIRNRLFQKMKIPADNPLTVKGVELGRMLFYDPILSSDSTISCASCHSPERSFSDDKRFSVGVNGQVGNINAMALVNLGWQSAFFWNGRAPSMEDQVLEPIQNPIEMHETLPSVIEKLNKSSVYPDKFKVAFGTSTITADLLGKAIAQFERILVSDNTPFDRYVEINQAAFTPEEFAGFLIFQSEDGECFHCHGSPLLNKTDSLFRNNGLDLNVDMPATKGYGAVTGKPTDNGKFKTPSLRNIPLTGPYMHDGRFQTLEEVIEHYSEGIQYNPNVDSFFKILNRPDYGGLHLSGQQKSDLLAFLKCLVDTSYLNNPEFKNPFAR